MATAVVHHPTCPHCAKPFSDGPFNPAAPVAYTTPLVLPCGHTSCGRCVQAAGMVCPECATPVPTPRRWVPNRALIDAIATLDGCPFGSAVVTATATPEPGADEEDEEKWGESPDDDAEVTEGAEGEATEESGGQKLSVSVRSTLMSRGGPGPKRSLSRMDLVMGRIFVHNCPICFESYSYGPMTRGARHPAILPCSHTFCMPCLLGMHTTCCPECRRPFGLPLVPNVPLMQLLSAAASAAASAGPCEMDICDAYIDYVADKPTRTGTDPVPFEVRWGDYQGEPVFVKTLDAEGKADESVVSAHFVRELACCQLMASHRAHEFPFIGAASPPSASRHRLVVHRLADDWEWPEYTRLYQNALAVASSAIDNALTDADLVGVCDMLVHLIGGGVSDNTSPRLLFVSLGGLAALYNAVVDDERALTPEARAVACNAMLFLSREWDARRELGAKGAAKELVRLCERHSRGCPRLVDSLLSVVWCLTMDESDAKRDVSHSAASFVRVCEAAMQLGADEQTASVLEKAMGVLWGVAVNTESWKVNDAKTRALYELGAPELIRSVLRRFPDHAGLCAEGCQLLWALSALPETRKALIASGTIELLSACAERHSDKGKVVGTALHTIGLLIVRKPDEIRKYIDGGGRERCLAAIRYFIDDSASLVRIMALFTSLATAEDVRGKLLDAEAVALFLGLMERYYDKDSLVSYVAVALKTPCLQLSEPKELLVACCVVQRVLKLVPQLSREAQLAEPLQLLAALCVLPQGKSAFAESDGLSALLALLRGNEALGVRKGCFDVLWGAVADAELRAQFAFAGGIAAALQVVRETKLQRMSSSTREAEMLASVCGCLSNVAPDHAQLFGEEGVALLCQLMQDSSVVRSTAAGTQCGNALVTLLRHEDMRAFFDRRCARNLVTAGSNFLHVPDKSAETLVRLFGCLALASGAQRLGGDVDWSPGIVLATRLPTVKHPKALEYYCEFLRNVSAGPQYAEVLKDSNVADTVVGFLRLGRSAPLVVLEAVRCLRNLAAMPRIVGAIAKRAAELRAVEVAFADDKDVLAELAPTLLAVSAFKPPPPSPRPRSRESAGDDSQGCRNCCCLQ
eukprot:m51a1_g8538 hypothetical protein (1090) ;mRNA; f:19019-23018